jgi:hypothetical protein
VGVVVLVLVVVPHRLVLGRQLQLQQHVWCGSTTRHPSPQEQGRGPGWGHMYTYTRTHLFQGGGDGLAAAELREALHVHVGDAAAPGQVLERRELGNGDPPRVLPGGEREGHRVGWA